MPLTISPAALYWYPPHNCLKNILLTEIAPNIKHRSESINIVILSLSAVAITWCSYQSNLWSGIQTFRLARVNATFREAQEKTMTIIEGQLLDGSVIVTFMNAVVANDTPKARMYIERSRPEIGSVLNAWLKEDPLHNKNAAIHPAATEEYRMLIKEKFADVERLRAKGSALWDEAEVANMNSDNYVLLTVIFSVIMFFCGVATKMDNQKRAYMMNVASAIVFIIMVLIVITKMPYASRDL